MQLTWTDYEQGLNPHSSALCPQPTDISTDTRTLLPGQWFLPLIGANFDGHTKIEEALQKGCRGYFTQNAPQHPTGVQVSNTLLAYQNAARAWRLQSNALCVALTGSVGKTTTREMLHAVFQEVGKNLQTSGNNNNEVGVPKTLLELTPEHDSTIIEIGARHKDDIGQLTPFVQPDIGLCLGAADAHLEIFGSQENLVRTKAQIFQERSTKVAIVPSRQPELVKLAQQTQAQTITFGESATSDVQMLSSHSTADGGMITKIGIHGHHHLITTPLFHNGWSHNIAAVCAVAIAAKVDMKHVVHGLRNFRGCPGRFYLTHTSKQTLIDDTYNASPASMHAGLQTLKNWKNKPVTLLLGDMGELGDNEQQAHLDLIDDINQLNPERLITVGNLTKNLHVAKHIQREHVTKAEDLDISMLSTYPFIYAKASHSVGLHRILKKLQSL